MDYSRTRRVVFLIDLTPILTLKDSSVFFSAVLSSASIFLSFSSFAYSLFSFKLFFSSLSPITSSSKLSRLASSTSFYSLSFENAASTFESLSQLLDTISKQKFESFPSLAKAEHLVASMRQLLHDYSWERYDNTADIVNCDDKSFVRENLVLLFSRADCDASWMSQFLDIDATDDREQDFGKFHDDFRQTLRGLVDAYNKRNIHVCWINVRYENDDIKTVICPKLLLEDWIQSLGWGFCSTSSIVSGSTIIPFGLIYPIIGVTPTFFNLNGSCDKIYGTLSLEILSSNGKLLKCKICDIELVSLKALPCLSSTQQTGTATCRLFCKSSRQGTLKVKVKALKNLCDCISHFDYVHYPIIMREFVKPIVEAEEENMFECAPDKILAMLALELRESISRKSVPLWHILVDFLYRQKCCALVSVSRGKAFDLHDAVLKPLTFSSALLSIIDEASLYNVGNNSMAESSLALDMICLNHSSKTKDCQDLVYPCVISGTARDEMKKCKTPDSSRLHTYRFHSSYDTANKCSNDGLFEMYYTRKYCSIPKRLKFFKCWIKQNKKSKDHTPDTGSGSEQLDDNSKEENATSSCLQHENEQLLSLSASAVENSFTDTSTAQDSIATCLNSENLDSYLDDISTKIQKALKSEGVNLSAFAERLVSSCMGCLHSKIDRNSLDSNISAGDSDHCSSDVILETMKLMLREPKDMKTICAGNGLDDIAVLEYELQVFFRMEILKLGIGSIEESIEQKLVRQICLLLEAIQCYHSSGFFGDWSLEKYTEEKIISRYGETLGEVVSEICTKLDLFSPAEEDGSALNSLNSEEIDQSWRDTNVTDLERVGVTELHSLGMLEGHDANARLGSEHDKHAWRLIEAQERRERARRFSSFTTWMPDLQRGWIPKQRNKHQAPKRCRVSKKGCGELNVHVVLETPMPRNKRICRQGSEGGYPCTGSMTGSVAKALFQE